MLDNANADAAHSFRQSECEHTGKVMRAAIAAKTKREYHCSVVQPNPRTGEAYWHRRANPKIFPRLCHELQLVHSERLGPVHGTGEAGRPVLLEF